MSDAATSLLLLLGLLEKGGNGNGGGPTPGPPPAPGPFPPEPGPSPTPVYPPTPGPVPPTPWVPPPPGVLPGPFPPIPPMPPPKPWPGPSPTPSNLPPFPGPGWTPDVPVSPAVSARASYWNPQLWNFATQSIVKPFVQEQFGGRWLTFKAAQHGTHNGNKVMATEAWRLASAPPAPGPTPPAPGPQPTPEHPGVNYSYTGQPQDAATIAEWGTKLTSVDAYDIANAWIVRMWEWAAGLTQAGYPGVDSVTPSGTDGRYGHDAHQALLDHGFPNAQPVAAARPAWWGKSGTYTNPGEPPAPSGAIPPESPVSATMRGRAPAAPHLAAMHLKL